MFTALTVSLYRFGLNWCYSIFDLDETEILKIGLNNKSGAVGQCLLIKTVHIVVFVGDDCIGQTVLRTLFWFYASFRVI